MLVLVNRLRVNVRWTEDLFKCVHVCTSCVCVCAILCVIYVCVSVYYQECIGQNNNITRSAVGTGIEYKHRI